MYQALRELPVLRFFSARGGLSRVWLAASAILVAAATLRLIGLGRHGFWAGELFHVFAAHSFNSAGTFSVPLWGEYTIAKPVTMLTAVTFRLFGESELAGRLPFVAIHVAFLAFSFSAIKRLFSPTVGLIYLFIMGFAPICVEFSREIRMFSMHQMFYFAAATSFLIGLEDLWRSASGASLRSYRIDARWILASGLFAAAAWVLHPLTATLAVPVILYLGTMTIAVWRRAGWKRAFICKYAIALVIVAGTAAAFQHRFPGRFTAILMEAGVIYDWQANLGMGKHYYRHLLTNQYPALLFIYPVGMYVAVRHHGRRGLFFSLFFLPLFFLLSVFVDRKSERYLMHLFPFFVVGAAAAIAPLSIWARDSFRLHFANRPARFKILSLALFAPAIMIFAHPWLGKSLRIPFQSRNPDWKSIDATFKRAVSEGIVVTPNPLEFVRYFDRLPDYYRSFEKREGIKPSVGYLKDAEAFHDSVTRGRDVYFLGAEWNFNNDAIMDVNMRNSVVFNMAPIEHGGDRRILAYHRD